MYTHSPCEGVPRRLLGQELEPPCDITQLGLDRRRIIRTLSPRHSRSYREPTRASFHFTEPSLENMQLLVQSPLPSPDDELGPITATAKVSFSLVPCKRGREHPRECLRSHRHETTMETSKDIPCISLLSLILSLRPSRTTSASNEVLAGTTSEQDYLLTSG